MFYITLFLFKYGKISKFCPFGRTVDSMGNIRSFIHGNAIVAEHAGEGIFNNLEGINNTNLLGLPRVWGKTYLGNAGIKNWFHAAIPTPILGSMIQLTDIFIFFRTDRLGGVIDPSVCHIEDIQVWDGPTSIKVIKPVPAVSGDHTLDPIYDQNAFKIDYHTMKYGLNIGMGVLFDVESTILFFSVGASFIYSD
jgi:hypothetical protein